MGIFRAVFRGIPFIQAIVFLQTNDETNQNTSLSVGSSLPKMNFTVAASAVSKTQFENVKVMSINPLGCYE